MAYRRPARARLTPRSIGCCSTRLPKKAIKAAIANPSELNHDLFDAQQARRVLDRLVGYKVSPLLWDKVKRGISAGRVQSVALRIIVEREKEREAFRAEEYWTLDAHLAARIRRRSRPGSTATKTSVSTTRPTSCPRPRRARLSPSASSKPFVVRKIERKEVRRSPAPPFITSRLQQEASRKLYFPPSRTMKIAQRLYEGVELGEQGATGLITYMRTDSPRVSDAGARRPRPYRGALRQAIPARSAELLSLRQVGPGRPRSDSSDLGRARSRIDRALPRQGRTRALHAHLTIASSRAR